MNKRWLLLLLLSSAYAFISHVAFAQTSSQKQSAPYRILFVGDSITQHGVNADTISVLHWDHVAGMAASDQSKDYVHLLTAKIQSLMGRRQVVIRMTSLAFGDDLPTSQRIVPVAADAASFGPNLVIIQHGEHEDIANGKEAVAKTYNALLDIFTLSANPPHIICVGNWSPTASNASDTDYDGWSAVIEQTMQEICSRRGIIFVPVAKIALNPLCHGWGQNPGVQWHPNDLGHAQYADTIFTAAKPMLLDEAAKE